jgi:RHS repeat-associated protein
VSTISRDGRPIVYSLSLAPAGMVIDSRTGQIAWTPNGRQTGSQQVIVRAATDNSHVDLQAFFIEVAPANTAPVVTSSPASPAAVGRLWSYPVMAQDAEQSELSYSLSVAPDGSSIDAETGLILWTPQSSQIGAHAFTVLVDDNAGGVSHHSFTLDVVSDAPSTLPFTIRSPRDNASLLTPYLSRVTGVDSSGQPLTVSLLSGPDGLSLDASGFIEWSPTAAQLGVQSLSVRFASASGSSEEHTYSISVRQTIGNSAPQIQSKPSSLFAIAGQLYAYDLLVIDTDNDALSFELLSAPDGMSIHPQLGTLRWLPTLDQLGQTSVTIRVTDPQGGSDNQSFTLTTRRLGGPPLIQSVPPTQAAMGIGYLYTVLAIDAENDPLTYSLIDAPGGMTIDSRTGEIAWTPTAEQLGQQAVFIVVSDASGNRSTQGFAVQVAAGLPNRPPVISSQPSLFASVGQLYSTTLQATDPEGTTVTYSLRRGPVGMTVDSATGQVNWTPTAGQAGRAIVTLVATDEQGGASVQSFEIDVLGVNTPPEIISTPPAFAWARGLFQYDVIARDSDRDPIRYEFVSSVPDGMTIDPLGRIRWQTGAGDVGSYSVTVRASDPRGGQATQQIDFEVRADNLPPKVTVLPRGGGWPWDGPIVVFVSAVDNVGVVDVELRVNGQLVPLDANRTARLSFDDWGPGVLNMEAHAWDAAGNFGTGSAIAFYRDPEVDYESGEGLPVATIKTPTKDETVYGMVQILGTAIGGTAAATGFKEYRLSYARADQLQFTEFVRSTTPVTDGLLGVWDTTLLENDAYILRLEVVSEAGNRSVHETSVGLSGNLKLGNFRLSFEDLTIPVAGIPITIVRTYDTLRADRDGDFGYGWRLEYRSTDLRVSLPKSGLEDLGIYTPFRPGTKIHMTLPGGQRVSWTFTPEMRVLPGWAKGNDLVMASPRYTPDRGNTATLSAGSGWLTVNQFGELYATGGMPWNPASPDFGGGFTVTLADGTRYFIDGTTGLMQTASDRNGNRLTFSDSGITSSLGDIGISIARDRHGRITSITDPAGNAIRYGYSSSGDLIRVTDREGHQTTMTYRFDYAHYLHEIIDPLGRKAARIDYDPDGRMSGISSGGNPGASLTYDPQNDLVSSTDALGNITLRGYDADGNITFVTDPLGRTTQWKFDAVGQVTEILSADGARTIIQRDSFGREVSRTSPLGEVTRYRYGTAGKLTGMTDALGNSWTYELDDRGNRIREIDPLGNTTVRSYDSIGRIISLVDPDGYRNEFSYSSNGWLSSIFYADGTVQSLEYDALGRAIKTEVVKQNMTDPIAVQFAYDSNGRPVAHTDALGNTSFSSFTALGDLNRIQDATGRSMTFGYDATGLRTSVQLDEGSSVLYQYDENGTFIGQTLPGGNRFSKVLDAAGQAVAVILPDLTPEDDSDNPRSLMSYDSLGRLISRQTSIGQEMTIEYDLNGRPTTSSQDGSESTSVYDAVGRLVYRRDETGDEQFFEYDSVGRLVSMTTWQGTSRMTYDRRGNLIVLQDPLGRTKQFEYDSLSRRIAVVETDGDRYEFEYNIFNKVTLQRDPAGRETLYEYDAAGRQTAVITPAGAVTRYEYDAAGRLLKVTRPGDLTIEFTYDSLGRLQTKRFADGTLVEIAYGPDGQVTSWSSGSDSLQSTYDTFGRLIQKRQPNGETIDYQYDAMGRIRAVTTNLGSTVYEFDEFNRLRSVNDGQSGTVRYGYDTVGRLTSKQFGNGVTEEYLFSTIGLLLRKTLRNADDQVLDQIDYDYDSFGRVTRQVRLDGCQRRFEYDLQDRLSRETYVDAGGVESFIAYTYDNVGNRRTMVTDLGTTVYEYDADDRLIKSTSPLSTLHYSYDAAGRRIAVDDGTNRREYTWAAEDRLTEVKIINAEGTQTIRYGYDPSGNRISRTENGLTTHYLVDEFLFGRSVVIEERPENAAATRYLSGLGREASTNNGNITYFSTDSRRSPLTATDSNGQVIQRFDWSAFGLPQNQLFPGVPGYTGELWDSAAELIHLRARDCDPKTGQFLSSDPFPYFNEITEGIHRYTYAHQSPTLLTDPTGLFSLPELSTVMKILSLGAITTGAIGHTVQSVFGYQVWDGWTALVYQSSNNIRIGLGVGVTLLSHSGYNHTTNQNTKTTAINLIPFETVSMSVPLEKAFQNDKVLLGSLMALQLAIISNPLGPVLAALGLFSVNSPIDIAVSSTQMFAPKHGDGTGAAFFGPYLSGGGGISTGIAATGIISGIQSKIAQRLDATTISTTFGYSFVIQGFSYGISKLNTGLTLKPGAGLQLIAGFSVGWAFESISDSPSTNP